MSPLTFFIAEISSNHNQDFQRSVELVESAAEAGFDAVKFQIFRIDSLFHADALRFMPELLDRRAWELPEDYLPKLSSVAHSRGIQFAVTPFHLDAVAVAAPFVDFFKVASYELLWEALLSACASAGVPVFVSTGMANVMEIEKAVATVERQGQPKPHLMHCVSCYPAPAGQVNLAAIEAMRLKTGCEVGWSDHSNDPAVILRAVHRWGASSVEMHLDLEGLGAEFSPGHCWLPDRAAEVISEIRRGIQADGHGRKSPMPCEIPERNWRADPSDGLRPLLKERSRLTSDEPQQS